jgi:hypothetical protein
VKSPGWTHLGPLGDDWLCVGPVKDHLMQTARLPSPCAKDDGICGLDVGEVQYVLVQEVTILSLAFRFGQHESLR